MRKLLLATTALVAFAGAAHAAESPLQVTVGGSVDFRAAQFSSTDSSATANRAYDFNTQYDLQFAASGKAANGVEYGALIDLTNDPFFVNTANDTLSVGQGYVWMSGAFGKAVLGESDGASSLFVYAPTVGENQFDGHYSYYTTGISAFNPILVAETETSNKVAYYTPKVGSENHKIQLGVSYAPNDESTYTNKGTSVQTTADSTDYRNVVEASAQYTGKFGAVSTVLSGTINTAQAGEAGTTDKDATAYGLGGQASYAGFTLGGSYYNAGSFGVARTSETKTAAVWTGGLKYEFDKVAVAINGENGKDKNNNIDDFAAVGLGATYTWFPGLTTAADVVFFDQDNAGTVRDDKGHVVMLSQKLTF